MAERAILGFLKNNEQIRDSGKFSAEHKLDHDEVKNAIRRLHGFCYVDAQNISRKKWGFTEEGNKYAAQGSPEVLGSSETWIEATGAYWNKQRDFGVKRQHKIPNTPGFGASTCSPGCSLDALSPARKF